MTSMTSREIRQAFFDFFISKNHRIVPSAPIVIKNDPTLMFTNAGMNQFKEIFLGEKSPAFARVADTQRCLRVSGKHNDLEEVGIDTYHHTMFEMLGNWSFGDYFKKEAIAWSWELLTEVYKLPKDRLYVTYFEGDEKEGLEKDTETYELWKQFVDEEHILPGNKKDNFWEMGETGPCGPCSEIHFDGREEGERLKVKGSALVNADNDQVIEIWNNVFMQFNRLKDGNLQPLPNKHVDTGMGFERLVRILQGKKSNYDTDVFQPLIKHIEEVSGIRYQQSGSQTDVAMRVMADHIRAISFAIADGQLPSNNKAGYVIRRILRRAVRYAYTFLNFKEPFLHTLVPVLAAQFKGVFDELISQQDFVQKVVMEEEMAFLKTLEKGLSRIKNFVSTSIVFNQGIEYALDVGEYSRNEASEILLDASSHELKNLIEENYKENKPVMSGVIAFELFDSNGFPFDLTTLILNEYGFEVDGAGFNHALNEQKTRSRAATAIDAGDWVSVSDDEGQDFVGYDELETTSRIVKYRKVSVKGKEQYQIVLDRTPFYAESGGQVGDTGVLISTGKNGEPRAIEVTDTKKENALIIHFTDELPEDVSAEFTAEVDPHKRQLSQDNHSATHLLHAALRQVLGTHVQQKGSLVNDQYLRFDFSHFSKVTDEEVAQIEKIVNRKIRENIPLKEERNVPYQQALDSGVTALFGEKYGDFVRVITFDDHFSKELCGGTHVKSTGEIGLFKIVAESAVAAGVRRIEAITADKAEEFIDEQQKVIHQLKTLLKNPKDISKSIENLLAENSRLKKEIEKTTLEKAAGLKDTLKAEAEELNGVHFIAKKVMLPNADAVKSLAYQLRDTIENLFLVLAIENEGKPNLTVMLSENLVKEKGMDAGKIVRELAKNIQGGGGGQAFFATAGGKDALGIEKALEQAKSFI